MTALVGRWMRFITVSLLFLSSYAVLFAALRVRFECPGWLRWRCGALAAVGVLSAVAIVGAQRSKSWEPAMLERVEDRSPEVGGYLATYLLPLIVIGTPTTRDIIAYALVFFVMGVVYVQGRMIQINPTLSLTGYVLFYVRTDEGFEGYLLTRSERRAGQHLRVVQRGRVLFDLGAIGEA